MVRTTVVLVGCILLPACSNLTVSSCEDFVKQQLNAPSTYKRISVSEETRPAALSDFSIGPTEIEHLAALNDAARGLAMHVVRLTYEAQNGFGIPVQRSEVCAFKLVAGKLEDRNRLKSLVGSALLERGIESDEASGVLAMQGYERVPRAKQKYTCCM